MYYYDSINDEYWYKNGQFLCKFIKYGPGVLFRHKRPFFILTCSDQNLFNSELPKPINNRFVLQTHSDRLKQFSFINITLDTIRDCSLHEFLYLWIPLLFHAKLGLKYPKKAFKIFI